MPLTSENLALAQRKGRHTRRSIVDILRKVKQATPRPQRVSIITPSATSRRKSTTGTEGTAAMSESSSHTDKSYDVLLRGINIPDPSLVMVKKVFVVAVLVVMAAALAIHLYTVYLLNQYSNNAELTNKVCRQTYYSAAIGHAAHTLALVQLGYKNDTLQDFYLKQLSAHADIFASITNDLRVAFDKGMFGALATVTVPDMVPMMSFINGEFEMISGSILQAANSFVHHARQVVLLDMAADPTWTFNPSLQFVLANAHSVFVDVFAKNGQEFAQDVWSNVSMVNTLLLSVCIASVVVLALLIAVVLRPLVASVQRNKHEVFELFLKLTPNLVETLQERATARLTFVHNVEEAVIRREQQEQQEREQEEQDQHSEHESALFPGPGKTVKTSKKKKKKRSFKRTFNRRKCGGLWRALANSVTLLRASSVLILGMVYFPVYYLSGVYKNRKYLEKAVAEIAVADYQASLLQLTLYNMQLLHSESAWDTLHMDLLPAYYQTNVESMVDNLFYMNSLADGLSYGNTSLNLEGNLRADSLEYDLLYNDGCVPHSAASAPDRPIECHPILRSGLEPGMTEFFTRMLGSAVTIMEQQWGDEFNDTMREGPPPTRNMTEWRGTEQVLMGQAVDISEFVRLYLQDSSLYLVDLFVKQATHVVSTMKVTGTILLLVFLWMCVGEFVCVQRPLFNKLDNQIRRTRSMLLMVPPQHVLSIPAMRQFLSKMVDRIRGKTRVSAAGLFS